MLKVVPDTNVLVSATIVQGKQFELLKLAKLGKIKLITSPEIIKEFEKVISRHRFGFSKEHVESAVKQLIEIMEIVIPQNKVKVVDEDPDDNIILECAIESNADFIVSGDSHLLALKSYKNARIVNAIEFFEKHYNEP
ncbi:putative toxin-antitoxin system toxin component, PIN family [Candidatus Pacearchaeota archaeon]|nr:putative toxin-antitoxin system toxin component, PIN family [Candidatus Pacearchaeota archaeon]